MITIEILEVRHAWPEKSGFTINRPYGRKDYTFLHFFGRMELFVDGKMIVTEPDACIFYAPDTPQWFHSDTDIVHDWMHIDTSLKYALQKFGIKENMVYYPQSGQFITELFATVENEWFSSRRYRGEKLESELNSFLVEFARNCAGENIQPPDRESFMLYNGIRQRIILHLDRHWTVKDMAKTANISPSRFHAVYRQMFGSSPMNDLIYARINTAKNRLLTENIPVCRLAFELGYMNQYHFIRQFKQLTGESPTAYRKRNIKG